MCRSGYRRKYSNSMNMQIKLLRVSFILCNREFCDLSRYESSVFNVKYVVFEAFNWCYPYHTRRRPQSYLYSRAQCGSLIVIQVVFAGSLH